MKTGYDRQLLIITGKDTFGKRNGSGVTIYGGLRLVPTRGGAGWINECSPIGYINRPRRDGVAIREYNAGRVEIEACGAG